MFMTHNTGDGFQKITLLGLQTESVFDGEVEHEVPPPEVQPSEVLEWARERKAFLDSGGKPKRLDPSRRTGIKRASTLYSLPYWEVWVF